MSRAGGVDERRSLITGESTRAQFNDSSCWPRWSPRPSARLSSTVQRPVIVDSRLSNSCDRRRRCFVSDNSHRLFLFSLDQQTMPGTSSSVGGETQMRLSGLVGPGSPSLFYLVRPRSTRVFPIFSLIFDAGIVSCTVQIFFAWRIAKISGNKWLAGVIVFIALLQVSLSGLFLPSIPSASHISLYWAAARPATDTVRIISPSPRTMFSLFFGTRAYISATDCHHDYWKCRVSAPVSAVFGSSSSTTSRRFLSFSPPPLSGSQAARSLISSSPLP